MCGLYDTIAKKAAMCTYVVINCIPISNQMLKNFIINMNVTVPWRWLLQIPDVKALVRAGGENLRIVRV